MFTGQDVHAVEPVAEAYLPPAQIVQSPAAVAPAVGLEVHLVADAQLVAPQHRAEVEVELRRQVGRVHRLDEAERLLDRRDVAAHLARPRRARPAAAAAATVAIAVVVAAAAPVVAAVVEAATVAAAAASASGDGGSSSEAMSVFGSSSNEILKSRHFAAREQVREPGTPGRASSSSDRASSSLAVSPPRPSLAVSSRRPSLTVSSRLVHR